MKKLVLAAVVLAALNPAALARTRAVRHPAEPCSFQLVPTWGTAPIPAAGQQRGMVLVYGQTAACSQWMSYSFVDWITVESGPLDAQPAAYVTVAANTTPQARTASLTIAGVRLDVTQEAGPTVRTPPSLVQNGTFDRNTDGWIWPAHFPNGTGTASWAPLDANGNAASGSMLMHDSTVGLSFQRQQCIPVQRSFPYRFGAKVRTGQSDDRGEGVIAVFTYPSTDCTGEFTSQVVRPLRPAQPGVWQEFSYTMVTGSRTQSVILVIGSTAVVSTFDTWFDDVFFEH